jgi:hypothetical protein
MVELQELGHSTLARAIVACVERTMAARPGKWRVVIKGLRASGNRVEGRRESTVTVPGSSREHEPGSVQGV